MIPLAHSAPPPKRWSLRARLLTALTVLCLAAVGVFIWWRVELKGEIEVRLEAIRAAGEPTSGREIDPWYQHVEDRENAALLWMQGFGELKFSSPTGLPQPFSERELPPRGQRLMTLQLEEAGAFLSSNAQARVTFVAAASKPRSRYPVTLAAGHQALLPHLSRLLNAARFLQMSALVRAQQGDTAATVADLQAMLGAARSLDSEPVLVSQNIRSTIAGMAVATTERALHLTTLQDAQLAALQKGFAAWEQEGGFARALVGERAAVISVFQNPRVRLKFIQDVSSDKKGNTFENTVLEPVLRMTGLLEKDLIFYLDTMATNIAVAKLTPRESFAARANDEAVFKRAKSHFYIYSSLILPALPPLISKNVTQIAQARVAQTVMAVERFRLANQGRPPESLTALVPEYLGRVPLDPFDGAPLRYQRGTAGYVVYSIGLDGKDNGGVERKQGKAATYRNYDLPFTVEDAK